MEKTVDPVNEIGENVTIADRNQLLSITKEQAKKIKSLRIENQQINNEVCDAPVLYDSGPEQVYFVSCSFSGNGEYILSQFPSVPKIGFIRCNLSYDLLDDLLCSKDPNVKVQVLDLTGNNLAKKPKRFVDVLKHKFILVGELILVDNGFDSKIISMIKNICPRIERIYI